MSTAGQTIVGLSGLSGVSAGQHLMAITAGSGGPSTTIYAPRMTVTTTIERLVVAQKPKLESVKAVEQPTQKKSNKSKYAYVRTSTPQYQVLTRPDELWVRMNKETTGT